MMKIFFFCGLLLFTSTCSYSQNITNFAGGGTSLGDNGPATSAQVSYPCCGNFDVYGNYYFGQDFGSPRVRMIDTSGIIYTVAGNGMIGFSGDGGPATNARFNQINGITVDKTGNIFISDLQNYRIRKVDASTHIITTIAGNGTAGYSGEGGQATNASISPAMLCIDTGGTIYFHDANEPYIRKISAAGIITTFAGNGINSCSGDGGPATDAAIGFGVGICTDSYGNLYIGSCDDAKIRKINKNTHVITLIAGTGLVPYTVDEIPATAAQFGEFGICIDKIGNMYIADYGNQRIRRIDTFGIIHTVAGNGTAGYGGDGGAATSASIHYPEGVATDACGNLYIADEANSRIRKVTFDTLCSLQTLAVETNNTCGWLNVYPNPVNQNLHIDYAVPFTTYEIYDLVGAIVQLGTLPRDRNSIPVHSLPQGMYLLQLTDTAGKRMVYKIIKQ